MMKNGLAYEKDLLLGMNLNEGSGFLNGIPNVHTDDFYIEPYKSFLRTADYMAEFLQLPYELIGQVLDKIYVYLSSSVKFITGYFIENVFSNRAPIRWKTRKLFLGYLKFLFISNR